MCKEKKSKGQKKQVEQIVSSEDDLMITFSLHSKSLTTFLFLQKWN
jgi:hypothetical protein